MKILTVDGKEYRILNQLPSIAVSIDGDILRNYYVTKVQWGKDKWIKFEFNKKSCGKIRIKGYHKPSVHRSELVLLAYISDPPSAYAVPDYKDGDKTNLALDNLKWTIKDRRKISDNRNRTCLKCNQRFLSHGVGNRICSNCNQINEQIQYQPMIAHAKI